MMFIGLGTAISGDGKNGPYIPPDPPAPSPTNPELISFKAIKNGVYVEFSIPQGLPGGVKKWVYFATDDVTYYDSEPFVPTEVTKTIGEYSFTNFTSQHEWQLTIGAMDSQGKIWWCPKDIYITPLANGGSELSTKPSTRVSTPSGFNITTTPESGSGPGLVICVDYPQTVYLSTE